MSNNQWVLKRNDTEEQVVLPQDMYWSDEFNWSKVAQATPQRTLGGGLIVQQGVKQNGRPITLQGDWVWLQRKDVNMLREWSDVPSLMMTLTHYDGRVFQVIFRTHEAAIASAEPVLYMTPETDSERYVLKLNLMTV